MAEISIGGRYDVLRIGNDWHYLVIRLRLRSRLASAWRLGVMMARNVILTETKPVGDMTATWCRLENKPEAPAWWIEYLTADKMTLCYLVQVARPVGNSGQMTKVYSTTTRDG